MSSIENSRHSFLRGLAFLFPLTGAGVARAASLHAATQGVGPDDDLIAAGEAWRHALAALYCARANQHAAERAYEATVGVAPPELILPWWACNEYFDAVGIPRGTISHRTVPTPAFDVVPDSEVDGLGNRVHTHKTLSAAVAFAPKNLGRAGKTPNLIRHWRSLMPAAAARDAVRESARRSADLGRTFPALQDAQKAERRAREAVEVLPAATFAGVVVKARLAEQELADHYEPQRARNGQRESLLAVYDAVLAIAGPDPAMPPHVGRYAREA